LINFCDICDLKFIYNSEGGAFKAQQASTMQAGSDVRFNRFMALVYLVTAVGLALTAFVSHQVASLISYAEY